MQVNKIRIGSRYYDEVINIYYKWWGKDIKKKTIKEIDGLYRNEAMEDLPVLYGLIINDTLIGIYEINSKDDINSRDYTPYLANVYVKEKYRGNGYSRVLINDAIKRTKDMNYSKLYLHSSHENYYEKFGFRYLEEVDSEYGKKRIYVNNL